MSSLSNSSGVPGEIIPLVGDCGGGSKNSGYNERVNSKAGAEVLAWTCLCV